MVIFTRGLFVCLLLVLNLLNKIEDLYVVWRLDFISSSDNKVGTDLRITEDLPLRDKRFVTFHSMVCFECTSWPRRKKSILLLFRGCMYGNATFWERIAKFNINFRVKFIYFFFYGL